ncbi:MAG: hypothetical protein GY816_16215 [Cytophagales bacterium]|nr:hypothetical protein [Cytophagales bacterium]
MKHIKGSLRLIVIIFVFLSYGNVPVKHIRQLMINEKEDNETNNEPK